MSKGAKRFLYKFGSLLILVITVFLVAYFISVDKEQRNREIEKSITEYMNSNYSYLSITGDVSISGNVMGLLDNGAKTSQKGDITDIPCDYCFNKLFEGSAGITSVSEDFLPAANLKISCYDGMFYQCTSLTNAPKLPSMNLDIFNTSLVQTMSYMFTGSSSLIYVFLSWTLKLSRAIIISFSFFISL